MQFVRRYHQRLVESAINLPDEFIDQPKSNAYKVRVFDVQKQQYYEALNFAASDLFCFLQNEYVKDAAISAIKQFGISNCSCHTLNGRITLHEELEQCVSQLKEMPYTLISKCMDGHCWFLK